MYNLEQFYRQSSDDVRSSGFSEAKARSFYADYVRFVATVAAPQAKILDVGCGTGWSSFLLSEEGFRTTGADLNARAFEPSSSERLDLVQASATALPFPDAAFDVVTSYQMLEHISEPQQALAEMLRVLKPGGVLCVVGPNLLGVSNAVHTIAKHVWRNRPVRRILFRDAQMSKHPFGNTLPEAILALFKSQFCLLQKVLKPELRFTMRQPDLRPPFHGDNDACYLCNPIDLCKWAKAANCKILQNGKPGRSQWTTALAGGTWIAMRKL